MTVTTKEAPKEITIELTRATTYVAPDLKTIFRKDTPYTLPSEEALEYLSKVDSYGIPYFKRWSGKKIPPVDPSLQGEVTKERGGGYRIMNRGAKRAAEAAAQDASGEIDTAAKVIQDAGQSTAGGSDSDDDGVDL